jgi:hypothetical protein
MRANLAQKLGLAVLTALFLVGGYALHLWFLAENCYPVEGAARAPALASVQGRFCGDPASPVSLVLLGFEAAAVVALIGLVLVRRDARDWLGKLGAWLVPVPVMALAWAALTLPPDGCSDSAAATNSPAACTTAARG